MNTNPIHVGLLVRTELFKQQKSVKWLAEQLGIQRANCYRILNAPSIHTSQLVHLSIAMHHDFFADCSDAIRDQLNAEQ